MKIKRDPFEGALLPGEYRKKVLAEKRPTLKEVTEPNEKKIKYPVPDEELRGVDEDVIQLEIRHYLERQGFFVFKASAQNVVKAGDSLRFAPLKKGIPDLICLKNGEYWGIEVKAASKSAKISTSQIRIMEEIRAKGGHAFAAHSVGVVMAYILVVTLNPNARLSWPIYKGYKSENRLF